MFDDSQQEDAIDLKILTCWVSVLKEIKKISSIGFCLSHLQILIVVFLNNGITRNELKEYIDAISPTTLKRYVNDLISDYQYLMEGGSESDSRVKKLYISDRGKLILEIIVNESHKCYDKK